MKKEQLLLKNLDRFDLYIAAVDRKSAFLLSFNTFVLGALLLNYDKLLSMYKIGKVQIVVVVLLSLCMLAIIGAIFTAFMATKPFLQSGNKTGGYVSLLFFNSIAEMELKTYSDHIEKLNDKDAIEDLVRQTHILAIGLKKKFRWIKASKYITIWGTLLCLEISFAILIIDYFVRP